MSGKSKINLFNKMSKEELNNEMSQYVAFYRYYQPIAAIVLMFVLIPFFDSLRVLSRTKGLARAFPMSTAELTGALTAVPAGLAVLWALAAAPAWILSGRAPATLAGLGHALTYGFVTAVAGLIAAIRWVSARPDRRAHV